VDAQRGVFEHLRVLVVDLEWIVLIEQVEIQGLSHTPAVYYKRILIAAAGGLRKLVPGDDFEQSLPNADQAVFGGQLRTIVAGQTG
jgi:hypothetical protein